MGQGEKNNRQSADVLRAEVPHFRTSRCIRIELKNRKVRKCGSKARKAEPEKITILIDGSGLTEKVYLNIINLING